MARSAGTPPRGPARRRIVERYDREPLVSAMATTQVGAALPVSWRICTTAGAAQATSWKLLNAVGQARALSWQLRVAVGRAQALSWAIVGQAVTATGGGTMRMETRAVARRRKPVGSTLLISWRILQRRGKRYSLPGRRPVRAHLAFGYRIAGRVARPLRGSWRLRSAVGRSKRLRWQVRSTTRGSQALSWRLATSTRAQLLLAYQVRTAAGRPARLRWRVRRSTTSRCSLSWRVARPVAQDLRLEWRRTTWWEENAEVLALEIDDDLLAVSAHKM